MTIVDGAGTCACGCGRPRPAPPAGGGRTPLYASRACQMRAYRARQSARPATPADPPSVAPLLAAVRELAAVLDAGETPSATQTDVVHAGMMALLARATPPRALSRRRYGYLPWVDAARVGRQLALAPDDDVDQVAERLRTAGALAVGPAQTSQRACRDWVDTWREQHPAAPAIAAVQDVPVVATPDPAPAGTTDGTRPSRDDRPRRRAARTPRPVVVRSDTGDRPLTEATSAAVRALAAAGVDTQPVLTRGEGGTTWTVTLDGVRLGEVVRDLGPHGGRVWRAAVGAGARLPDTAPTRTAAVDMIVGHLSDLARRARRATLRAS
ncbi:hypothetical protein [Frankia sp. ACN1ag]|uniref:hypothetical protein n=1 Tax=Frankia sp. ACN1ag TaxID=102891 RepID=UPI0006DCC838|nr:hypothetical protein [Frankia sp. ACN1ag]